VYNDKPNLFAKAEEQLSKSASFSYSLGLSVNAEGKIGDVIMGSPAYQSGLGPGMKLVAVNGRKWTPTVLHAAVKAAQGTDLPIELLVENAQYFKTYPIAYHDGEKNPHLERVPDQPDVLADILKPLTH
jgi:predicted metalloprotease with PDZ domain